jgi:tubulin-specific chaperone D
VLISQHQLEPFQEWPQLLDPLLPELLRPLVDAFLKNLVAGRREHGSRSTAPGPGFSSISCGICCILNILCKVRGVKVVTMFFNTEPKYLEPMLEALCLNQSYFVWQERYILLLWLSQLVLTPFDLQSISSLHNIPITRARVPEDLEPQRLPVIAIALLSAGLDNLSAAGKERESAGRLLVRIALRPDMQHLGLLGRLVKLMCKRLQEYTQEPSVSMYECLGSLSILSGIVKSGSADDIAPFLASTFGFCLKAATAESVDFSVIRASAPARKMLVAILRTLTLHAISLNSKESAEGISDEKLYGMLEDTIRYLLDGLADRDNPVRLAASKALSMLVLKINENMKTEVVQAVLDSLEEDVLYDKPDSGDPIPIMLLTREDMQRMSRNVMAVNPLKWQGLLMTLGHLLFRRTASPDQLSPILRALLSGLDFEQRSAGGTSIGGSVRDAACFGFWSLARKYATSDLQSIEPLSVLPTLKATFPAKGESSLLQIVADRLVVAACLDPSGNIRRGSSAALQELIGRHPDTVLQGIALVQVVDYHAVARRSRAMLDVAKGAAELAGVYRWTLLNALLGWRGVRAVDEQSRRTAASAISKLVSLGQFSDSFTVLRTAQNQLSRLPRENSKTIAETRHGLLLTISRILDSTDSATLANRNSTDSFSTATLLQELWEGVRMDGTTLGNFKGRFISELILEGTANLIASLARTESGGCLKSSEQALEVLDLCLTRADHDVSLVACADAAFRLFSRLSKRQRVECIGKWLDPNQRRHASFSCRGRILACGSVYATLPERAVANDTNWEESSRSRIFTQLRDFIQSDWPIETQVVALRSLASTIPHLGDESLEGPLCSALDNYTNDQRGDVGSLARFEAVQAVSTLLQKITKQQTGKPTHHIVKPLIQRLFRLAGEKLDKLRFAAWKCIEIFLRSVGLRSAQS